MLVKVLEELEIGPIEEQEPPCAAARALASFGRAAVPALLAHLEPAVLEGGFNPVVVESLGTVGPDAAAASARLDALRERLARVQPDSWRLEALDAARRRIQGC